MPRLHVCSLARIAEVVEFTGAGAMVTLLSPGTRVLRPERIAPERHLNIAVSDIVEQRLLGAIFLRFGLPPRMAPDLAKAIKAADREAAYFEATALAGFAVAEARQFFGAPRVALLGLAAYLEPLRPNEAQERFLGRFAELDAA